MPDSTTSHFKDIKIEHNMNDFIKKYNPDLHLEIDYSERLRTKT